jgi:hypothetical protein
VDDADVELRIEDSLRRLAADRRGREEMSHAGRATIDGKGAARVAKEVLDLCA